MNLATIQTIIDVLPHDNADTLEIAKVLGWQVIVRKGQYKAGYQCVYVGLDSILPEKPEFEFMRSKDFRVKSIKLRGQISQGILFPMAILPDGYYREGEDVTEIIGVTKYEKPIPANMAGVMVGGFPSHIIGKTDEERLQNDPRMLEQMQGQEVYVTVKYDGTSSTFFKLDGEFRLCSRNLELKKENEGNVYGRVNKKYNLENMPDGFALQGETYGEGIQGNPSGIKDIDFAVFNVYDIANRKFLPYNEALAFCGNLNVPFVKCVYHGPCKWQTVDELLEYVETIKYENGKQAEGIVVRLTSMEESVKYRKPLSFKVISNSYALKHGE